METVINLLPKNIISALGWTFLHSLWQGALIAIFLGLALVFLKRSSAALRYNLACLCLALLLITSLLTFMIEYNSAAKTLPALPSKAYVNETVNTDGMVYLSLGEAPEPKFKTTILSYFENLNHYLAGNINMVVLFWFAGLVFFILKTLGGFAYSQRLKYHKTYQIDDEWNKILKQLSDKLGIDRKIKMVESALIKVPMLIGHFKPVILLPLGLVTGLPQGQIESILAHELAHIKRNDYLINIFQSVIEVIFFFNPAMWFISNKIKAEREDACDDIAIDTSGNSVVYSWALLNLQQQKDIDPDFAMTLFKKNKELLRRVNRMVRKGKKAAAYTGKMISALMVMLLSLSLFMACSSINDDYVYNYDNETEDFFDNYPDGRQTLRFYDNIDGEDIEWRVKFDDDEITAIYKNGERLSKEDAGKEERYIRREMRKLENDLAELKEDKIRLNVDLEDLNEEMEELSEELSSAHSHHSRVHVNHGELKRAVKDLKKNLSGLKVNLKNFDFDHDFDFDFDDDLHFDFNDDIKIDIDMDDFEEKMERFGEVMNEFSNDFKDYHIDMKEFDRNMDKFDVKMKDIGFDMHELKNEMKKLKRVLHEFKQELVTDGYIEDIDDNVTIKYRHDEIYIDGTRVPADRKEKYLNMYKKHFDEYPDDDFRMEL